MADADGMGSMPSSQISEDTRERLIGTQGNNEKDTILGVDDGIGPGLNQNDIGNLQISVVEGRNFEVKGGLAFRPCVELQIGEQKVRTDTLKDTLSLSWLADFNLAVPSQDSQLWVSVINSDLLLDDEALIGRAAIYVNDLLCCGTRVQWIQMKDHNNNTVGEICLVLRYSNYQAPSSTGASTSSEMRDDNQYGLKALLCQCPPQSSTSSLRCISDDDYNVAHTTLPSSMMKDVLNENQLETLSPEDAEGIATYPSAPGSPVLQMKLLFDESEKPCEVVQGSKLEGKESSCRGSQSYNDQHKKVAFVGAFMAILAAISWGSKFCKKRIEDQDKVIHPLKRTPNQDIFKPSGEFHN